MNALKRLLTNLEEIVCGSFLVAMIALVILNVILRYLFDTSITWSEEVATICFVWCVFLGASATYKHKMDMGIDVLVKLTPPKIERAISIFTKLLLLTLNAYLFYISIIFTTIAWEKPTAVLGISSAVFNSALIVSFALISLHSLRFVLQDLKKMRNWS